MASQVIKPVATAAIKKDAPKPIVGVSEPLIPFTRNKMPTPNKNAVTKNIIDFH